MHAAVPYCGVAPVPGELLARFNLDPALIVALFFALALHIRCQPDATERESRRIVTGWSIVAFALISPLCALSVALLSGRVAQLLLMLFVAAPLIATGATPARRSAGSAGRAATVFAALLWFWLLPAPYQVTFSSTGVFWCMHVSLLASAVWLWRELLHYPAEQSSPALVAGLCTSVQLGLLGTALSMARLPLYAPHFTTTAAFGLTPLEDQELAGALILVPAIGLALVIAARWLTRLRSSLEGARA